MLKLNRFAGAVITLAIAASLLSHTWARVRPEPSDPYTAGGVWPHVEQVFARPEDEPLLLEGPGCFQQHVWVSSC